MKIQIFNPCKVLLLALVCFTSSVAGAQDQQQLFEEYHKQAGDKAMLYAGKHAANYPITRYMNHPYWDTDTFQEGSILFEGNLYTKVALRYDTFTRQLAVLTPESGNAILVDMEKVESFTKQDLLFVRHNDRFEALLYNSPRLQLLQSIESRYGTGVEREMIVYRTFARTTRYTLCMAGKEYNVSNRASVLKLFPNIKKELKRYAKAERLNFKHNRAEALTRLCTYADQLLTPNR